MTTTDLTMPFTFDGHQVRTITKGGNVYFCGRDVATTLGYENPGKAVRMHCNQDGGPKRYPIIDSLGRTQDAVFISEPDLYRLIASSKLPEAQRFEKWIFDEVLPAIRRHGMYATPEAAEAFIRNPDALLHALTALRDEQNRRRELEAKVEADQPKVLFADSVAASQTSILIGELAKLLKQNGVDTGQNRLFAWMRDNDYLIKRKGTDRNMPTQRSMEMGLFEVKERTTTSPDGHIMIHKTTKVTGKGQQYFLNLFLQDRKSA